MKGGNSNAQNRTEMMHARFRAQFWKTETCRFWRSGCRNAASCPFAHGEEELHHRPDLAKTSLCQRWSKGTCPLEAHECRFAHGPLDLRTTPNYAKFSMNSSKADAGGAHEAPVPNRGGGEHHASSLGPIQNGLPLTGSPGPLSSNGADMQASLFSEGTGGIPEEALEPRPHYPVPPPPAPLSAASAAARNQRRPPPGQAGFRNSHGYAMAGPTSYFSGGWDEAGAQKPMGDEQGSKELLFVGPPPDGQWVAPSAEALPPPSELLVSVNGPQPQPQRPMGAPPPPTTAPPPPAPRGPPPVPMVPMAPQAAMSSTAVGVGYPARYEDQMCSPDFANNLAMGHHNAAFALNGVNSHDLHNGVHMGWPTNGHAISRTNGHMANSQMVSQLFTTHDPSANGLVDARAYASQPENQAADQQYSGGPPLSSMPWPGQGGVPEELRAIWS